MRIKPQFTMLLGVAFGVSCLLAHSPAADASKRRRPLKPRRVVKRTKRTRPTLPKVVEVRLKDKPANLEALLNKENRGFLGKVRLDPRLATHLAQQLVQTREGTAERGLVELFDQGLSNLRTMYGKARAVSTREAIKIETRRMAAITGTFLAARSLRFKDEKDGARTITSARITDMDLTVGNSRAMSYVGTTLKGRESLVGLSDHYIVRPYSDKNGKLTANELGEDILNLHPLARKPIDSIAMRRLTFSKRNGSKEINWVKMEKTLITAAEEARTWQRGTKETGSDWRYTTHKGWTTLSEGPIKVVKPTKLP